MLNASVLSALLTYFSSDGSYSDMDKLHKLQKGAAVVITGSNYDIRSTEIFDQLGWEMIEIIPKKLANNMTSKTSRCETANSWDSLEPFSVILSGGQSKMY